MSSLFVFSLEGSQCDLPKLKKICVRIYSTTITEDLLFFINVCQLVPITRNKINSQKKPFIWIVLLPRRLIEASVIKFPSTAPSDTISRLCQASAINDWYTGISGGCFEPVQMTFSA